MSKGISSLKDRMGRNYDFKTPLTTTEHQFANLVLYASLMTDCFWVFPQWNQ